MTHTICRDGTVDEGTVCIQDLVTSPTGHIREVTGVSGALPFLCLSI